MNKLLSALALIVSVLTASCVQDTHAQGPAAQKPGVIEIGRETYVKPVCLNGVAYYVTGMAVDADSIAGHYYFVVGGPVYEPGHTMPRTCDKPNGEQAVE